MVRSLKNTFAPINRIPSDVLSIIPDYWADEDTADEDLITLTHICRGWRKFFTSRPSLWSYLDCTSVEKTRVYIERSKSSPLNVRLGGGKCSHYLLNDAFLLMVPHLGRLRSLTFFGSSGGFIELVNKRFNCPAPFLEKLDIFFTPDPHLITTAILDRNLSSLRELHLFGVLTNLPWKNLTNLTRFKLCHVPSNGISLTKLLDFFEQTPLLTNIKLWDAFPTISDAPLGRVVCLPHLKKLNIKADPAPSILLEHLSIPSGASLVLVGQFDIKKFPVLDCLPKTSRKLKNLSHITSISLYCDSRSCLRLDGPSGGISIFTRPAGAVDSPHLVYSRLLRSLGCFGILATERLTITSYNISLPSKIKKSSVYQALFFMNALRTLTLVDCLNSPFISALNPSQTSGTLLCPELEELVLYIGREERFHVDELLEMVMERSLRGARLSTISIVSSPKFMPVEGVFELRNYVSSVEYRLDDIARLRTRILGDFGDEGDW